MKDFLLELKPNEKGDKNLWQATKHIKRRIIRYPPIQTETGEWLKTSKEKADKFASHLETQFTPFNSNSDDTEIIDFLTSPMHIDLPIPPFTTNEVKNEIRYLNDKKASGHDGITSIRLVKALPENAIPILILIFNAILRLGVFPTVWKNSTVILIPKPDKPEHFLNSYQSV